jgi:hypothetical protein
MDRRRNDKKMTPEERVLAAARPPVERQSMVDDLLVPYPQFREGRDFIQDFHFPVKGGSHSRGRIGGLLGESRVGKSEILKSYLARNPPRVDDEGEAYPVIYVAASDEMKLPSMVDRICVATGSRSLSVKHKMVFDAALLRLVKAKAELLIIDDAHFMFDRRTSTDQRNFISFVKMACDMNRLNVLLVGEDSIEDTVEATPYLSGRRFISKKLKSFSTVDTEMERFKLLMNDIDVRLPFNQLSKLNAPAYANDIHRFSGGLIGRVMALVQLAAYAAINDGTACIMKEHFRAASNSLIPHDRSRSYFK